MEVAGALAMIALRACLFTVLVLGGIYLLQLLGGA